MMEPLPKPENNLPSAAPISLERLYGLLTQAKRVLLIAGQPIDGDSLASAVALRAVLTKLNVSTDIACAARVPDFLRFLIRQIRILPQPDFLSYQAIVILDCGELKQTGYLEQLSTIIKSH